MQELERHEVRMGLSVNGVEIPEGAIGFELKRLIQFYSQHMPEEQIEEQMETLKAKARDQAIGHTCLSKKPSAGVYTCRRPKSRSPFRR